MFNFLQELGFEDVSVTEYNLNDINLPWWMKRENAPSRTPRVRLLFVAKKKAQ